MWVIIEGVPQRRVKRTVVVDAANELWLCTIKQSNMCEYIVICKMHVNIFVIWTN